MSRSYRKTKNHPNMKKPITLLFNAVLLITGTYCFNSCSAPEKVEPEIYSVASPDGKIMLEINVGNKILLSISHDKNEVLADSPVSLALEGNNFMGIDPEITGVVR